MRFLVGELFLLNWYFFLMFLSFFCEPNKNVLFKRKDCEPPVLNNVYCWYMFARVQTGYKQDTNRIQYVYNIFRNVPKVYNPVDTRPYVALE